MMGKKLILASLAAMCIMAAPVAEAETITPASPTPFVDITGHWAEREIAKLYIHGVLTVNETATFRPDDEVTRAELLTLFLKAKGIVPLPAITSSFADVPSDSWIAPYAELAYRLGIVHGKKIAGALYLEPTAPVSRQELVSMLMRAKGKSGRVNQLLWSATIKTLNQYPDGDAVDEAFQRPFAYALRSKLVNPFPDGTLQPNKRMTRAEAATYAALYLLTDDSGKPKLGVGTPYERMLQVQTTAYSYASDEIKSYLEFPLREGIVAVDPNVIPLGTHLYIEGYGYAVAADTGGAVKRNHVDLYLPSRQAALTYGIKANRKVYILD
jgi:3D (Asp-Asp-Asp) domain-containing protein